MCPKCQGFSERVRILHPYECYDLVRQLEQVVSEGTLVHVTGNCRLADIHRDAPWPQDHIEHTFRCVACGLLFRFYVDTYHGSGGAWDTFDETESRQI